MNDEESREGVGGAEGTGGGEGGMKGENEERENGGGGEKMQDSRSLHRRPFQTSHLRWIGCLLLLRSLTASLLPFFFLPFSYRFFPPPFSEFFI